MRQASLAPRDPATGRSLLGATYVRDMLLRGRGSKENLEIICAASGLSFDFVWDNHGPALLQGLTSDQLVVNRSALRKLMEQGFVWSGAQPDNARLMADLILAKIATLPTQD